MKREKANVNIQVRKKERKKKVARREMCGRFKKKMEEGGSFSSSLFPFLKTFDRHRVCVCACVGLVTQQLADRILEPPSPIEPSNKK